MPVRRNAESPLPVTAFHSTVDMGNRILHNMYEKPTMKDFPLSRLSGPKTIVTYFRQRSTQSNAQVSINTFNDIDPDTHSFDRIENFAIIHTGETGVSDIGEDNQIILREEGEAAILPMTIRPTPNDYFISMGDESFRLFRVTNIRSEVPGMEKDPGFIISFVLEEKNFKYEESRLKKSVVTDNVLRFEYVGTNYKTIFDATESRVLDRFEDVYREYRDHYKHLFYSKRENAFFLSYKFIDQANRPFMTTKDLSPDAVLERNKWAEKELYDRVVSAFLAKTLVFADDNKGALIVATNYLTADRDIYSGTIFDAMERQNYKVLRKWFFEPRPIPYTGPESHPVLFGKIELFPVMSQTDGILNLFPSGFVERLNLPADISPEYKTKPYSNGFALLSDILTLHVNGKEPDLIIERLAYFCQEDRFFAGILDEPRTEFLYYVLPIVGYLLQQGMETIARGLTEKAKEIVVTSR